MKIVVNNQSTLSAEVLIVAQENLKKLVAETKCPNSKSLLDKKVFKLSLVRFFLCYMVIKL